MFYRTVFVFLFGFVLVKMVKMDSPVITFNIRVDHPEGKPTLMCDHVNDTKEQHMYTVYEGEIFRIVTKYSNFINHVTCHADTDAKEKIFSNHKAIYSTNTTKEIIFTGEKSMGTPWKCNVLAHLNNDAIKPVVKKAFNETYSAAYCYMKIHVRQTKAPQVIVVNNIQIKANRTNLSDDVDFIAEYPYKDGDEVNVTCIGARDKFLTMEYMMAGVMSNKSTMDDLKSQKIIGFTTRLHSGHDNSYMICTHTEDDDYTRLMVIFVKRTVSNYISIAIDGKVLPPFPKDPNHFYEIDYKYVINESMNVTCEVQRADLKFLLFDEEFIKKKNISYTKRVFSNNMGATMSFVLSGSNKKIECAVDYPNSTTAERAKIRFRKGYILADKYPLQISDMPSEGRVLELFNDYKLNVIFYEFQDDETFILRCGKLRIPISGPVVYLQLESQTCKDKDCYVNKTVTRKEVNETVICYLKEEHDPSDSISSTTEVVRREIRVVFRNKIFTTTTSTTIPTPTIVATTAEYKTPEGTISTDPANGSLGQSGTAEDYSWLMKLAIIIACCVVCIIIICASIVIIKLRKRNHSQGGPRFESLQEPSESSIPAHPPQWEINYAVPVDRRTDDTTYSVPCVPDLYATPTPKNLRNKKQKPFDPTYAVLAVPNNRGQKNVFKETEDPNYSEVYANGPEECYAKVLPKSQRNVEQDNPYSYAVNDRPLAYALDSEPMYCEAGKASDAEYANLNNSHYANSDVPEYVEPTYCEPQKRM